MTPLRKYYKASYDAATITYTIVLSFILLVLFAFMLLSLLVIPYLGAILVIWLVFVAIMMMLSSPHSYIIEEDGISIVRVRKNIVISFPDVAEISYAGNPGITKMMGSGNRGYFGYAGRHPYFGSGWARVYSRKAKDMVMIETIANEVYLIAPDSPEDFVEDTISLMKMLGSKIEDNGDDGIESYEAEEPEFAEVVDY